MPPPSSLTRETNIVGPALWESKVNADLLDFGQRCTVALSSCNTDKVLIERYEVPPDEVLVPEDNRSLLEKMLRRD